MKFLRSGLLADDNSSDHRPFAYTALLPHNSRIQRAVRFPYRRRIRGVHSSSRFDRTPLTLLRAVLAYVTGRNILTFTEVSSPERRKALRALGWGTVQSDGNGGRGECALMYAKWAWQEVGFTTVPLSTTKIPSRGQYCYALIVNLRHRRTKQLVKVMVVHLPAHIESALGQGRRTAQSQVYSDCINFMAHLAKGWAKEPTLHGALIVGDWNISWRQRWVREYIRESFPDYVCNWEGRVPPTGGTHGSRIIDFALVSKDVR